MRKPGYEATLEIIKSAAEMPVAQAIETLIACAKSGYTLASVKAVQKLARLSHPSIAPHLAELYTWLEEDPSKRDKACDIRMAITEAFGEIGTVTGIETLKKAIRTVQIARLGPTPEDVAIGLRATAALALVQVDADSLYELAILLFDEEPAIPTVPINRPFVKAPTRRAAAQAMGILGDAGGAAILAVKLKFPGEEVQEVLADCLEALISLRPSYLLEVVQPYLTGDDEYLSAITALALAQTMGQKVLPLLLDTLEIMHGEAKEAIVIAISVIRSSHTKQILLDFLDDPSPFVRRGAAKGIKTYLDDTVIEKLQKMRTADPDKFVRQAAELED